MSAFLARTATTCVGADKITGERCARRNYVIGRPSRNEKDQMYSVQLLDRIKLRRRTTEVVVGLEKVIELVSDWPSVCMYGSRRPIETPLEHLLDYIRFVRANCLTVVIPTTVKTVSSGSLFHVENIPHWTWTSCGFCWENKNTKRTRVVVG